MATYRIVFSTMTTSDLRFSDCNITFDGEMAIVWQGTEKRFAVPVKNVIAIEKAPEPEPAAPAEPESAS